ncbi:MAG: imidazole glycerol phosphate synthase subunit HisH [Myxococcota bacterium]|nr:imidazole glycerol phosphate synthase subunit HisH [Myxococcota bacterium]
MSVPFVSILRTGLANLASVCAAFERLNVGWKVIEVEEEILDSDYLVLPGVGSFGACMEGLEKRALVSPLRERFSVGKPLLSICLGMQLAGQESEESPGSEGLGVVAGPVIRLPDTYSVPQIGWNKVISSPNHRYIRDGYAYFANSYAFGATVVGWDVATFDYGGEYVAAMERGPQLICQFHPELSGEWGETLLKRWLGLGVA